MAIESTDEHPKSLDGQDETNNDSNLSLLEITSISNKCTNQATNAEGQLSHIDLHTDKLFSKCDDGQSKTKGNNKRDTNGTTLFTGIFDYNKLSESDRQGLHCTADQVKRIRAEIAKNAQDPATILHEVTRRPEVKVIAIGERHQSLLVDDKNYVEQHREFGAKVMHQLKLDGIGYLAIECTPEALQTYLTSGNMSKMGQLDTPGYRKLLKSAKKEGIQIVAAPIDLHKIKDLNNADQNIMDESMFSTVSELLEKVPKHKVLFWVGEAHLSDYHRDLSNPNSSAGERLRRTLGDNAVVTFAEESKPPAPESNLSNLLKITPDLQKVVALHMKDCKATSELATDSLATETFGQIYDYILLYPPSKDTSASPKP